MCAPVASHRVFVADRGPQHGAACLGLHLKPEFWKRRFSAFFNVRKVEEESVEPRTARHIVVPRNVIMVPDVVLARVVVQHLQILRVDVRHARHVCDAVRDGGHYGVLGALVRRAPRVGRRARLTNHGRKPSVRHARTRVHALAEPFIPSARRQRSHLFSGEEVVEHDHPRVRAHHPRFEVLEVPKRARKRLVHVANLDGSHAAGHGAAPHGGVEQVASFARFCTVRHHVARVLSTLARLGPVLAELVLIHAGGLGVHSLHAF
mmetsp:Transcript_48632/g.96293  ORF Transcript_48632/g.96293 Transcript_48632/m.96293 type:complete len:263 (-) Transcript_48632:161-949(-)